MIRRFTLTLALALCCAAQVNAQKIVTFDGGSAAVTLPETFIAVPRNDGMLRAVFGPAGDHRLEFELKEAEAPDQSPEPGQQFVRAEAKRLGLGAVVLPGKTVLTIPGDDTIIGGRTFRAQIWRVGFGGTVVSVTLTAPAEATPELTRFLAAELDPMLRSLRRVGRP